MNYAIILAGGIGKRLWPLSTERKPKQFLKLASSQPLIVESINRISSLYPKDNIYIAVNRLHKNLILRCLQQIYIPKTNFFFEKERKNTFAPIAVLSAEISRKDKNAVIGVFPSDQFIKKKKEFLRVLKKAIESAEYDNIVTLGISPKRPETGFGYIKIRLNDKFQKEKIFEVDRFIEKPDLRTARKIIKDKSYYWNGGIFIFKAKVLLEEIKAFKPKIHQILTRIRSKKDLDRLWHIFPCVSVDYAIMEKTNKLRLLALDCGWSDLGSWDAIRELKKKSCV